LIAQHKTKELMKYIRNSKEIHLLNKKLTKLLLGENRIPLYYSIN